MSRLDLSPLHSSPTPPLTIIQALGLEHRAPMGSDTVLFCCPEHDDSRPSARAQRRDGLFLWTCPVCGAGGDILHLVAATQGLSIRTDFHRVVELAAHAVGVTIAALPLGGPLPAPRSSAEVLAAAIADRGERWAAGRMLTAPAVEPTRGEVDEALSLLLEVDAFRLSLPLPSAKVRRERERAYWAARLEAEADRYDRWAAAPRYDGPIHTSADGPPPLAYQEHRLALARWTADGAGASK